MAITLQTNGVDYTGFTSVKVQRSIEDVSGGFSFISVTKDVPNFPIRVDDECVAYVEGEQVLTGFVERIGVQYDNGSHQLVIQGRDKTCDIVDSTVDDRVIYNPPISLKTVIERVISNLGISEMQVIQNVPIAIFSKKEIEAATIGDSLFSFLETLGKLRQVLITTDGKGNILLDQASKNKIKTVIVGKKNSPLNMIKSCSADLNNTKRFGVYRCYSQANAVAMIDIPQTPNQLTNKRGLVSVDKEIRSTRQFNFTSEKSADDVELKNRAIWEANLRRARSAVFSCVVPGHIALADDIIWKPNLLVQIDDDFSNTQGTFLLKDVTYNFDLDGGSTTELSFVVRDAYTLQASLDAQAAKTNFQGKKFIV